MSRKSIQETLESIIQNVYSTPPSRMSYPCVKYERSLTTTNNADNGGYRNTDQYQLVYIYKDVDDENVKKILSLFKSIRLNRTYNANGLYHAVYELNDMGGI